MSRPEHACCKFTLQHLITLGTIHGCGLRSTISDLPGHLGKFNLEWHPYCFWASITFLDIGFKTTKLVTSIVCHTALSLSPSTPALFVDSIPTMRFFLTFWHVRFSFTSVFHSRFCVIILILNFSVSPVRYQLINQTYSYLSIYLFILPSHISNSRDCMMNTHSGNIHSAPFALRFRLIDFHSNFPNSSSESRNQLTFPVLRQTWCYAYTHFVGAALTHRLQVFLALLQRRPPSVIPMTTPIYSPNICIICVSNIVPIHSWLREFYLIIPPSSLSPSYCT